MEKRISWEQPITLEELTPSIRELVDKYQHSRITVHADSIMNHFELITRVIRTFESPKLLVIGSGTEALTAALSQVTPDCHTKVLDQPMTDGPAVDVVIYSAEKNYRALFQALEALWPEHSKDKMPVVFIHGTGFPHARRDFFHPEAAVPESLRKGGHLSIFAKSSSDSGIYYKESFTQQEGPETGLFSAIETFVAKLKQPARTAFVPSLGGLTLLWKPEGLESEALHVLEEIAGSASNLESTLSLAELSRLVLMQRVHEAGREWQRNRQYIMRLQEKLGIESTRAVKGSKENGILNLTMQAVFGQPANQVNYLCHFSKKHRFLYVETPKVACSTIKRFLQFTENGVLLSGSVVHERSKSPLLAPKDDPEGFLKSVTAAEVFRFTFVRNPFSRLLSGYLDKIIQSDYERNRLSSKFGYDPGKPPTFLEFIELLSSGEMIYKDIHFMPQTKLIAYNKIDYNFIGRFENFASDFNTVVERLGGSLTDQFTSNAHKTNASEKILEFYGRREIDLARRLYQRDFELLKYDPEPS